MVGITPAIGGKMRGFMSPTREEFERAIAASPEAMLVCDPEGRIVGANPSLCALTGYAREDLLSKKIDDLAAVREADADKLLPALRRDATLAMESDVRFKDGSTTRLHFSVRSMRLGERPHSVIRVARRRRASDRLSEDPEFIRALLRTPSTLVVAVCREGRICFASAAFEQLTGLKFREVRGRKLWDLVERAEEAAALRDAIGRPDGARPLTLTWSGRTTGWTLAVVDAVPPTPQVFLLAGEERRGGAKGRGLEKRIGELTAQLEELRGEQEAFTHTLAHDLRAPLRAMSCFSHALIEDYAERTLDRDGVATASKITESARHMDELIEDLLVFNRLSRVPVHLGPVAVQALMSEVVGTFAREIAAQRAVVEVAPTGEEVVADWTLLYLVCCQLLSNALKFVPAGVAPQARIRAVRDGERVRIEVEDNGIGIPSEYVDRIFGVFQRLNKAEAYEGTGMGLAIVRKAVDRMNGRVGLTSEPEKGSRFWVELLSAKG